MGLLQDIQISLLDENAKIGPILLKLRYLADRLGSNVLEEWVRQETEGYLPKSEVPIYRKTSIAYTGTFTNGFRTLTNVGVAPYHIKKFGGEEWVDFDIVDPLQVVENSIEHAKPGDQFSIDTGNLKLLIDGKIYEGMSCIGLDATIDRSAFVKILVAVRAKLLDFTLKLEKEVPVSLLISVGEKSVINAVDIAAVTQLTQNIFNAPVNNILSSGASSPVYVSVIQGNIESLEKALIEKGLNQNDAKELASLASEEKPEPNQSFGVKAKKWIAEKVSLGADGVLKVAGKALEDDIAELFQQYYDAFIK